MLNGSPYKLLFQRRGRESLDADSTRSSLITRAQMERFQLLDPDDPEDLAWLKAWGDEKSLWNEANLFEDVVSDLQRYAKMRAEQRNAMPSKYELASHLVDHARLILRLDLESGDPDVLARFRQVGDERDFWACGASYDDVLTEIRERKKRLIWRKSL